MFDDQVVIERRGAALWIRLDRPAKMNALTPSILDGLNAALDMAAADPAIVAVAITGTGSAFCAGADLQGLMDMSGVDDSLNAFVAHTAATMTRLELFPKPAIAAVNGIATAGGLEIVLSCDLVIAARSATFGDGHANFGLLPGAGASVRLPRKIGPTRAKYLLFTGDFMSADDCAAMGLVNQVVDTAELEAVVDRIVTKLAAKSPIGLQRMKQLVDDGLDQPRATALRLELAVGALHAVSFDSNEGIAAFNEKRRPQFQGR